MDQRGPLWGGGEPVYRGNGAVHPPQRPFTSARRGVLTIHPDPGDGRIPLNSRQRQLNRSRTIRRERRKLSRRATHEAVMRKRITQKIILKTRVIFVLRK